MQHLEHVQVYVNYILVTKGDVLKHPQIQVSDILPIDGWSEGYCCKI